MRILGVFVVSALMAHGAAAQQLGWSIGFVSSGVDWLYPPPPPSDYPQIIGASSNTDRKSVTVGGSIRQEVRPWLSLGSGLRIVPKGFEVTGPTFHMVYAEVPVIGIVHTGRASGVFAEAGGLIGARVHCRRFFDGVDGRHEDGCGRVSDARYELRPLRRADLSWVLGVGARLGNPSDGWWGVAARLQRSFIDLDPEERGTKIVNRVFTISLFFERPSLTNR